MPISFIASHGSSALRHNTVDVQCPAPLRGNPTLTATPPIPIPATNIVATNAVVVLMIDESPMWCATGTGGDKVEAC